MEYVSNKDYFKVSSSIISNVDIDIAVNLYQPLIGHNALSLFLTLSSIDNQSTLTHDILLNKMMMNSSDFNKARSILEAIGLVKTLMRSLDDSKIYTYKVYAPKSPKDYFDDVLLKGMLIKNIGKEEAEKLADRYAIMLDTNDGSNDVSSTFREVFNIDLDDNVFLTQINQNLKNKKVGKENTGFDFSILIDELTKNGIKKSLLTKKITNEVERIASLYSIDELTMSEIVLNSLETNSEKGVSIDLVKLNELANQNDRLSLLTKKIRNSSSELDSETLLAKKVKLMESISPYNFLRLKQNNTKPAPSDMKIVNDLSSNFRLNTGVINCLLDYVLEKQNNKLPRAYIETIAASIARENIDSTLDAMNYLNNSGVKSKTKTKENSFDLLSSQSVEDEISDFLDFINE